MLQAMRTGAKNPLLKYTFFGLLLLAMGGLSLIDGQGWSTVRSKNVAEVGREKITSTEFSQMVQATIRNQGMTESQAYSAGLPRQILEQEITTRIFRRAAQDLGIVVDDQTAARHIKNILTPLTQQGMSEEEALSRILMSFNLSERRFVDSVKSQIAADHLVDALSAGAQAPQQLVDDALKYRYEWRQGEYFRLTSADAGKVPEPSEADLKAHYAKISSRFSLPEYRSFAVLVLDKKALGLDGKFSDDLLRQQYEDNISDYTTPETRAISQAVVKDEAVAKEIFSRANNSKDLKSAADAAGKGAANFIPSSPATEKDLPREYADKVFNAQAGEVIGPVETALGWHVLHIEKVMPPSVKPFDSVKEKIAAEMSDEKSLELLYDRASEIDDMIAGGSTLAEVATELKITPLQFTKVDANGTGITPLPASDKVLAAVFELENGEATQLIETPEGAFLIAEVTDIIPSAEQPFEKVKDKVAAELKQEQAARLLDDKAAKIVERLQLGEAFAKVAREMGKKIETTGLLQRSESPAKTATLPRGLLPSLFALDKEGQSTAVADGDGMLILRLAGRKVEVPKNAKEEDVENLTAMLNRSLQNDILDQYRQALMAEYDVEINDSLLEEMFRPRDEDEK